MGLTQEEKDERLIATKDIVCIDPTRDNSEFVFISYKSDDWKIAINDVVRNLQKTYGLRIYFDGDFDKHDSSWVEHMQNAISSGGCVAVLAFISKKYTQSYACLMELLMTCHPDAMFMRFDNTPVPIIPIIVDDSQDLKGTITRSVEKVHITEWGPYNDMLIRIKEDERVYSENRNFRAVIDDLLALKNNVTLGRISAAFYRLLLDSQIKVYTGQPEQLELIYSTIKNRSEYAFDEMLKGEFVQIETSVPEEVEEEVPEAVVCEVVQITEETPVEEPAEQKTVDDYISEAEQGDKEAEAYLVQLLMEEGSIKVCKALAKIGNVDAQLELARLHVHGSLGIKKDVKESIRWYCLAYKSGSEEAKENLLQLLEKNDSDELYELAESLGVESGNRKTKRERELLEKAEAGELKAYVELGDMYLQGDGVKQDIATAAGYYVKAQDMEYTYADNPIKSNVKKYDAEREYAEAWISKGDEYLGEKKIYKAEKCYLKAISFYPHDDAFIKMAELEKQRGAAYGTVLSWYGKVSALRREEAETQRRKYILSCWDEIVSKKSLQLLFDAAEGLYAEEKYREAFTWYLRLGEAGQKRFGQKAEEMLKKGLVEESELSDDELLALAKISKDEGSCYKLGMRYLNGDGIRQDYEKARKCFEEDLYYAEANLELGNIYRLGLGVEADEYRAIDYYLEGLYLKMWLDADVDLEEKEEEIQELLEAEDLLEVYWEMFCERGDEALEEKDYEEAEAWYSDAAKQGYEDSYFKMAEIALLRNDIDTAESWYKEVTGSRKAEAEEELAKLDKIRRKQEEELLAKKAGAGTADEKMEIAMMYLFGDTVAQDYEQARSWFEQAYAQGCDKAMLYLGALYADGKGVKKDIKRAASYFCAAERAGVEECDVFMGPYMHVAAFRKICADIYLEKARELGLKDGVACFERAASLGHKDAYLEMARLYEALNTAEGDAKALELYERAKSENGHNTKPDIAAIKVRQEKRLQAQKEKEQPKVQVSATVESYYKQAMMFMKSSPALADAYLEKAANGGHPEAIKILEERKLKTTPTKQAPSKQVEKRQDTSTKTSTPVKKQNATKTITQSKNKEKDALSEEIVNIFDEEESLEDLIKEISIDFELLEEIPSTPSYPEKASIEDTEGKSYQARVFYYKEAFDDVDAKYQKTGRGVEELLDACYCYALILSEENDMSGLALNIWKYLLRLVEEYEQSGKKSAYTKSEIYTAIAELYEGELLHDPAKALEYREKAKKEK